MNLTFSGSGEYLSASFYNGLDVYISTTPSAPMYLGNNNNPNKVLTVNGDMYIKGGHWISNSPTYMGYPIASSTTSTISSNTLTIGGAILGSFVVGTVISGPGVTTAKITALGTGTGGAGTYTINGSPQTITYPVAINGKVPLPTNGCMLNVNGNATVAGIVTSTPVAPSDYRIKQNVENLDDTFTVDALRPVHYINTLSKREDIGFIAHEVQAVYPYLVTGQKDGTENQSLNYIGLLGIIAHELKNCKKQLTDLDTRIGLIETLRM